MSASLTTVIADLRAQVQQMEGTAARWPMPTHPVLAKLVKLRSGAVYQVQAPSLAMLVMAGPSAAGAWCAVIGVPQFGAEAAGELGVRIDRLVHIPEVPEQELLSVIAALINVVDVIVLPAVHITAHQAARLLARMREGHCFIVTWGAWPQSDAVIGWSQIEWHGVGQGHGHLRARQVTVEARERGRLLGTERIWFPDAELQIRLVENPLVIEAPPLLRSVP